MAMPQPGSRSSKKTKFVIGLLILVCFALLVAAIVLSVKSSTSSGKEFVSCTSSTPLSEPSYTVYHGLFRDLSKEEIHRVRDYVLNEPSLNVTVFAEATLSSNYIFLIELHNPDKDEAVAYLDGSSSEMPRRQARVVIFNGAFSPPIVQEILVPVEKPNSHNAFNPGQKNPIPYRDRPMDLLEESKLQNMIDKFTQKASAMMWESFQMNCSTTCAAWIPSYPSSRGKRSIWVRLHRSVIGPTTHPLPVELFIQVNSNDVRKWEIEKVVYHNMVFDSVDDFLAAYKSGNISKVFEAPQKGPSYSSLNTRGTSRTSSPKLEPRQYEPGGKRYTAEENHVEYMRWSFDFRMRSSSGLQLFDIRFNNTRIAYELGVQEAAAFYGGFSPVATFADYLDSSWTIGQSFELVKGVDCPVTASYFDVIAYVNSGQATKRKNAICIFELNLGMPLRRHYEYDGQGGYVIYGGISNTALVVRSVLTPYNYDYIYDYIFYQNGVIEVKVMSSGYIMSSYWTSEERRFSNRVYDHVAGSNHDHIFHFKVDLDIAGRENSFEVIHTKVNESSRWVWNGDKRYVKYFEREHKKTEKAALYTYNFQTPSYLNFYNKNAQNAHGVRRGYRVQLNGIMNQMYPRKWSYTKAIRWSYYQLAVTKYKKNETRSSSIYNQMDFHDPMINFEQFIEDDEDIASEDLVSWVTVGVMHIPSSEDIPTTTTVGNAAGFLLRPFNYFDEDPSIASPDNVVITPNGKTSKIKRSERSGHPSCVPLDEPLTYIGRLIDL